MTTPNMIDGCWDKAVNTAQGGYHYMASNPYLTVSVLAIGGIVVIGFIILALLLVAKANKAQQITMPPIPEPTYKVTTKTTTTVSKKKKKTKKKK